MTISEIKEILNNSKQFSEEAGIYVQDETSISLFQLNRKEKDSMDSLIQNIETQKVEKNPLQDFFDSYSERKLVATNTKVIESQETASIAIDCGCGDGVYLSTLANKFDIVIAVDISLEAVTYSKKMHSHCENIVYICGSMLDLNNVFNEPIADFLLSAEVIEHVPSPDIYLENLYSLLNKDKNLLISTPASNIYFYPLQFISMVLTKPITLYKLLNPLKYWEFALNWHPALSKNDLLMILEKHNFSVISRESFIPYYFEKFPIVFYIVQLLPEPIALSLYKKYLNIYNKLVENLDFGIRQHAIVQKNKL